MTRTNAKGATKAAPATAAKAARPPVAKAATAPAAKRATPAKKAVVKKAAAGSKPAVADKPMAKATLDAPKTVQKPEVKENKEPKLKKVKLVRDSFTMPEAEYAVLGDVKKACLKAGIEVKKSELLRVGVALIRQLDTARLQEILNTLPTLKAGRPKKSK